MKIAIISGRFPQSQFSSNLNHKIYCSKNGYTYINCCWPTGAKNRYMNKMMFIKEYYNLFDYIFWIDDDAFFLDHSIKLEKFLPKEGSFLSICKSPKFKEVFTVFSSGQFFLKCDEIGCEFIDKVMKQDLNEVKKWWKESYGFFTNGDQDSMLYLCETDERFVGKYDLWEYQSFNSRTENLFDIEKHKIFLIHFTGRPEIKMKNYLKVEKHLDLLPGLLSNDDYQNYSIRLAPKSLLQRIYKLLSKFK
jgi:hypothetical protein